MLKINNLKKSFGGIVATDNVNLELEKQTINAIIGPNGAGKTTLFNLITGKLKSDSGSIFIENREITNLDETETTHIGIARAFQITNIFPNLTVYESIKLALLSKKNGLNNMWTRFKNHKVNNDAGGQKKKLVIALSLLSEPKLLLLDEPTAGMGPEERWKMIDRIKELWKKTKITIVFIEHDMDIVFGIAQKIFVLQQGAILAEGNPQEIKKNQKVIKAYLGGGKK